MAVTPPPVVWVITDLGPTDAPGFLLQGVTVTEDVDTDNPDHIWGWSTTPFTGDYAACRHDDGFELGEDGLHRCRICAEWFHPDQLRAWLTPTGGGPYRLEPGHRDLYTRQPADEPRTARDYLPDPETCTHFWRSIKRGRVCRRCHLVEVA